MKTLELSTLMLVSLLLLSACGGEDVAPPPGYVSMDVSEDAEEIVLTRIHTETSVRPAMLPGPPRALQSVSAETWEDLWKGALVGEKPEVDFSQEIILALALDVYQNRIEAYFSPTRGYQLPSHIYVPLEVTPDARLELYRAPRPQ